MKQLALSVTQYINDNDGRALVAHGSGASQSFSQTAVVWDPLGPYIKSDQILFCPSAPKWVGPTIAYNSHYGFPTNWNPDTGFIAAATAIARTPNSGVVVPLLDQFPEPSRTWLLGETRHSSSYTTKGWGGHIINLTNVFSAFSQMHPDRHFEGSNFAYMDGHVKWIKKDEFMRVYAQENVGGSCRGFTTANASNYPVIPCWKQ